MHGAARLRGANETREIEINPICFYLCILSEHHNKCMQYISLQNYRQRACSLWLHMLTCRSLDTEFLVVLITKGSQGIPGYMLIIKLLIQQNILATTLGVFSLLTSPTCCTKPRVALPRLALHRNNFKTLFSKRN